MSDKSTVVELGDDKYYLGCSCGDPTCCIMLWHDTEDHYVVICPQLNQYLPWYKRLWHGLAFILGRKPTKCHFGEIVTDVRSLIALADLMTPPDKREPTQIELTQAEVDGE